MRIFRQQGLSLVELMLAMGVGLLLMTFVVQAFVANKATNRFNEGLSEIQEAGRYGIDLLRADIRMSAYRLDPTTAPVLNPLQGADNDLNGNDSLTISYQGNLDCLGNPVVAPAVVQNIFNLQQINPPINRWALFCNNVPILPGVEALQFEYGVDLTNDGAANVYLSAANADMNRVVSVRMAMLLATEDSVGSSTNNRLYTLLDPAQPVGPFGDQRLRRVFSLTVVIRNSNDDNS